MTTTSFESLRASAPTSRIIDGATLRAGARVRRFDIGALALPDLAEPTVNRRRTPAAAPSPPPAPAEPAVDIEALHRAALEAAYREGLEAGMREAAVAFEALRAQQIDAAVERLDTVAMRFSERLDGLERTLATEVIELAVEMARQTVRATVALRRDHVVPVVQEALAALVDETAKPVVSLHPDDVAPVAQRLEALLQRRGGSLVADPTLSPGDCRVRTSASAVDATLAKRWQRALATIGRHEEWIE